MTCGQIQSHPYHTYKIEDMCLHCSRRRDTRLASFEVHAIRDTVYRESELGPTACRVEQSRVGMHPLVENISRGGRGTEDNGNLKPLPQQLSMSMLRRSVHLQGETQRLTVALQQQQQTPWRLTLPPAEIPTTGWGLAGMRDGEWI